MMKTLSPQLENQVAECAPEQKRSQGGIFNLARSEANRKFIRHLEVENISQHPGKLKIAHKMVAEGYSTLSSFSPDPAGIVKELCEDEYFKKNLTVTLLARGWNPNTNRMNEPLGTVRAVLGVESAKLDQSEPLEFMDLFTPKETDWLQFNFEGFNPSETAELGRFAILPELRHGSAKKMGLQKILVRVLVEELIHVCTIQHKRKQMWAVQPSNIARLTKIAGFRMLKAPDLMLNFEHHSELFHKYDKYWLQGDPGLYRIKLPMQGQSELVNRSRKTPEVILA